MRNAASILSIVVFASLGSAGPQAVHAEDPPARVETTVLVRIDQADHEGVDGSSLRVSPRSLHVAWRAEAAHGSSWTVDGKKGKPYATTGSLVFSHDGASYAYFAERVEKQLLVVDGQERAIEGVSPDEDTLRMLPGGRAAFFGLPAGAAEPGPRALWLDGALGAEFRMLNDKSLVFSGDGKRWAFVALTEDGGTVVADGKPGKSYPPRAIGALRFSADGTRLAYSVTTQMVVDGVEGPKYLQALPPNFAPSGARMFYVAVRADSRPVLVVDGKEEPELMDIAAPGPVWSADGQHLGYVAMKVVDKKTARRVVIDGVDQPAFPRIGAESLRLSPDGKRHAYWVVNGPKVFFVVDGVAQKEADEVRTDAAFSADSKRVTYSVKRGGKWFVVTDGAEGPPVDGIMVGFPVFTSDSAHVVYEAELGDAVHVFVDGKPGPAFEGFAENGFALGQGSSSVAVVARRGDTWRIVVDGVESSEEFMALLPGSSLVADGPRSFRAWAARGAELLHLRATVTPGGAPR